MMTTLSLASFDSSRRRERERERLAPHSLHLRAHRTNLREPSQKNMKIAFATTPAKPAKIRNYHEKREIFHKKPGQKARIIKKINDHIMKDFWCFVDFAT
ncbi:hypothetical protein [Bifidobacterium leontopitheci]|uniref:hypothetical protein n=1 Tax=Bifidobacterium leontopitheci TaxID=2650774 RepID=UPI00126555D2|nr:hypothetical protein [Bifidobacterium leontopitheci]